MTQSLEADKKEGVEQELSERERHEMAKGLLGSFYEALMANPQFTEATAKLFLGRPSTSDSKSVSFGAYYISGESQTLLGRSFAGIAAFHRGSTENNESLSTWVRVSVGDYSNHFFFDQLTAHNKGIFLHDTPEAAKKINEFIANINTPTEQ